MDREQLEDILVLAEVLHFSEAAEQLNLTQSALSKRVKALEEELGERIFIRTTRKIELSPFGKEFIPYAQQILTGYRSADLFLQKYKADHTQSISLGVIRNPQCYGIDRIFLSFQTAHPEIHLKLCEEELAELVRLFRAGKINLYCTCSILPHVEDEGFVAVGRGHLVAVMPKNHPETISYDAENLMLPGADDPFGRLIEQKLQAEGRHPNVVYNGGAAGCISLVRAGIGIAIMPVEPAREYLDGTFRVKDVFPDITYDFGLGYRTGKKLSQAEQIFVRYVREVYEM
ncbi:MAG: LysR family transcriptional regulator [Lachnospiraceae bacterium]